MERSYPLVITIVGAESSGKTMLAKQLAEALSCQWLPEYAREYLEKLDRPYEFEDLEEMAREQWGSLPAPSPLKGNNEDLTDKIQTSISDLVISLKTLEKEVIIVDSGMLTIRMWARIKYGKTIPFVEEKIRQDPTSLYLLCRPRIEWGIDPLREAPSLVDRVWIYNQYLKELVENNLPFKIMVT
ncbi:MAG TPA: ATP-binding protein [Saprospiraceae bacterium]|nr:ATP-binding protein [Saprospiraceae bacterium]